MYCLTIKYFRDEWYYNNPFKTYPEINFKIFKTMTGLNNHILSIKETYKERAKQILDKYKEGILKYDSDDSENISNSLHDLLFLDDSFYDDYETEDEQLTAIIKHQICHWTIKEVDVDLNNEMIIDFSTIYID